MSNVIHVTEDNFEEVVLKSKVPVIVDFWAPWCGPCKAIAPILDVLSIEREDVKIVKVDVDENPNLSAKFRIRSIPTISIFKDAELEATKVGAVTKQSLIAWVDSVI